MKKIYLAAFAITLLSLGAAKASVTFSIANYTGSSNGPNGIPIMTLAGIAAPAGTAFASIGTFTGVPDFSSMSATTLLGMFQSVDSSPIGMNAVRPGLFNGQDYNSATNVYPDGFKGKVGYIVVGNNANISLSTAIAIFSTGTQFPEQDGANNATYNLVSTSDASNLRYGALGKLTAQPNPASATPFTQGVQMIAVPVPEPSSILLGMLGMLGLLRRKRK